MEQGRIKVYEECAPKVISNYLFFVLEHKPLSQKDQEDDNNSDTSDDEFIEGRDIDNYKAKDYSIWYLSLSTLMD